MVGVQRKKPRIPPGLLIGTYEGSDGPTVVAMGVDPVGASVSHDVGDFRFPTVSHIDSDHRVALVDSTPVMSSGLVDIVIVRCPGNRTNRSTEDRSSCGSYRRSTEGGGHGSGSEEWSNPRNNEQTSRSEQRRPGTGGCPADGTAGCSLAGLLGCTLGRVVIAMRVVVISVVDLIVGVRYHFA